MIYIYFTCSTSKTALTIDFDSTQFADAITFIKKARQNNPYFEILNIIASHEIISLLANNHLI